MKHCCNRHSPEEMDRFLIRKPRRVYTSSTRYIVMRSPVLMEDEGRHCYVNSFSSKAEAQQWIAKQKDEYFKPQDYYIAEDSK